MAFRANGRGLFPSALTGVGVVDSVPSGWLPAAGAGLGLGAQGCEKIVKHSWSFNAASRIEQLSMAATKSRTLPPTRSPRAATHEFEWHAHAFLRVFTMKLCALYVDVCVGKGQRPRRWQPLRRRSMIP